MPEYRVSKSTFERPLRWKAWCEKHPDEMLVAVRVDQFFEDFKKVSWRHSDPDLTLGDMAKNYVVITEAAS